MKKIEFAIEAIKATVLATFLLIAFKAAIWADFWQPAATLLKAGILGAAYFAGRHFADTYEEGWRNYLLLFYAAGIITLIAWAALGMHVEDSDLLYGGGEPGVDFVPTAAHRSRHALTVFLSLLVPSTIGMYRKRVAV